VKLRNDRVKAWIFVGLVANLPPVVKQPVVLKLNDLVPATGREPEAVVHRPIDGTKAEEAGGRIELHAEHELIQRRLAELG
jgi:hypothetical protein